MSVDPDAWDQARLKSEVEFCISQAGRMRRDEREVAFALEIKRLTSVVNETRWRSIDTAPKDGTTIFGENAIMGQRGMVYWNGYEWELVNGISNTPMGMGFYPSHWMPLPKPPEDAL